MLTYPRAVGHTQGLPGGGGNGLISLTLWPARLRSERRKSVMFSNTPVSGPPLSSKIKSFCFCGLNLPIFVKLEIKTEI